MSYFHPKTVLTFGTTIDPIKHLVELLSFTRDETQFVQWGAFILWEKIIKAAFTRSVGAERSLWPKFKNLKIDFSLILPLIRDVNVVKRERGITLLLISNYPVTESIYKEELLAIMANAQEQSEINALENLLQNIPISKSVEAGWKYLIETILSHPQIYSAQILAAAINRYSSLVGEAGPDIMGNELALGLPLMTT